MIAVDTNVLVRLLTRDDPGQGSASRVLFSAEQIWIAKTVLLETAWALRSIYGFDQGAISDAFTKLLGLKNVQAEDESALAAALLLTAHGIEFADAIQLSSRPHGTTFVTFDKAFVRRTKRAGISERGLLEAQNRLLGGTSSNAGNVATSEIDKVSAEEAKTAGVPGNSHLLGGGCMWIYRHARMAPQFIICDM